jgi:hypothetical protein
VRKFHVILSVDDFEQLVSRGEVVESVRPESGLMTERRLSEMFDLHISLDPSIERDVLRALLDKER